MALSAVHGATAFSVGDVLRVHQRIQEGGKTRIQVFEGMAIAIRGERGNKSFVVRRVGSAGVGIERIFPLFSPIIEKVEVKSKGNVHRSKLYYLRGKSAHEVAEVTKKSAKHSVSKKSRRKSSKKSK